MQISEKAVKKVSVHYTGTVYGCSLLPRPALAEYLAFHLQLQKNTKASAKKFI